MGQPSGKPVKKPYLQHRTGVVFRHRPIEHQLNNCMKTLREMIDLIESAQSGRPELRTWGNRSTGETHYSVDGVEVGKDQYYQAWRADQKNQGNPDIKEEEVDEAYTPSAGELARDLIKMPDSDFNKKYGMSKQQANRYYSSNKLKEPGMDEGLQTRTCPQCDGSGKDTLYHNKPCQRCNGKGHVPVNKEQDVAEAQKTDNRPASQFDKEIVKAQPDGSCELKCGHKTSAKLSKNPVGKKIFCARCYELRNKKEGVAEGSTVAYEVEWIDKNTGEQGLTTVSALTSQDAADKLVKMKLQQLDNVDVTDVFPAHKQTTDKEQSVDEDQATAKMGLMSAMGSNDNNPADQRRAMAQQAVEQLAAKR